MALTVSGGGYAVNVRGGALTSFPVADTGKPMGRPALKPTIKTVKTTIRLPEDLMRQGEVAAGDRPLAQFIREAIEEKIVRERAKP